MVKPANEIITDNLEDNELSNPLVKLKQIAQYDLDKVDQIILSMIQNKISLIPDISEHTISSGGKRLRPLLTLIAAKMCGYNSENGSANISLAASVEFIHTATLLHDDVVDKSELRRGNKTANNLWGNKESVLVGDFLLGKAFDLMGDADSIEVYKTLSNAALIISEGEVLQLSCEGNINITQKIYFDIITAKTAKLFSAASKVGAIIANKSNSQIEALSNYGLNLGIAFQIIDDLLDYFSSKNISGKNIGDDFFDRKITLPLIIAMQNAKSDDKEFWQKILTKSEPTQDDLALVINKMQQENIYEQVINIAKEYANKAVDDLSIFDDSIYKDSLVDLANYTVSRLY